MMGVRSFLAKQYTKVLPRSLFIGVVGSVGKTLTVKSCKSVLSEKFEVLSSFDFGQISDSDHASRLPEVILKSKRKFKKVIVELGIERSGAVDHYLEFVRPEALIVTRTSVSHTKSLGSFENFIEEEEKLVEQLPSEGTIFLNWDDPQTRKLAEKTNANTIFYGFDEKNCHVWASKVRIENFRNIFELNYGVERIEIVSQTLGFHQIYPLLAAAALALNEGMSLIIIKRGLEKVEQEDHCLKPLPGINGSVVLDDTMDATPIAVEEAIETLSKVPARRRIVVLGEMKGLGSISERMHREIARKIYKEKIDLCLLGSGEAQVIADELLSLGFIPERLHSGLNNSQIGSTLLKLVGRGDVVLIKGEKTSRLEEIVKRISKAKK